MIQIESLAVSYGSAEVFSDVSMRVDEGQIVALIGNNGAGKTTLLRAVTGLLGRQGGRVTRGRVTTDGGVDLVRSRTEATVRRGIVHVPEGRRVFAQLSVEDNLMAGTLSVRSSAAIARSHARVIDLFPILADRAHQPAGLLSGGEQQMLAIGRALMSEPKMLLMDEPSLGIAPMVARQIMATVNEINRDGTGVLLVEQNTMLALSVAQYGYVLNAGSIVAEGPAESLSGSDQLLEIALGKSTAHHRDITHPTSGASA